MEKPLTKMQSLLILRIFRLDRVLLEVRKFVVDNLGSKYTERPSFNLEQSYQDSSPNKPLIFILSSGVDPLISFYALAEEKNMSKNIYSLSLGQGQSSIALNMINEAIKNGFWVMLQNCHVSVSFLNELEKIYTDVITKHLNY